MKSEELKKKILAIEEELVELKEEYKEAVLQEQLELVLESKTKRLNLLIKPSTYEKLKKINTEDSLNGLVNKLLEKFISENQKI